MTFKKDSLLLRIITYNGVAIVLVSAIMALLFGLITINEINSRLLDKSREKINILDKAYVAIIEKTGRELFNAVTTALNLVTLNFEETGGVAQEKLAEVVKNQLNIESYSRYNKSFVQIISTNRTVLSENGAREIKYDIIGSDELVPFISTLETKSYYFVGTNNNIYVRIIQQYRLNRAFEKNYIILTMPLSNFNFERVRDFIDLEFHDKIFILSKNRYIAGELNIDVEKDFIKNTFKSKKNKNLLEYNFYFSDMKVNGEPYYLAMNSLKNNNGSVVGNIGIAISKRNSQVIKYMLATIILAVAFLSVVISTALCARIFIKILNPLSILTEKMQEIGQLGNENTQIELEEETIYEIRAIANSIKNLSERISRNENLLLNKNEKLNSNLNRVVAVEKILMALDINKNFTESIGELLKALTSEMGMGYSRALYLEYDKEKNILCAKEVSINPYISSNIEKYTKGIDGFSFQIKDFQNLLPLLKVKYETGNLFSDSMEANKIIFYNEKGYKFNFGNELFKSLGFKNFLLFPITDKDIKLGCILVDYFGKNRKISEEEVEVMTLLLMNLIVRVKNDLQEEEKLTNERILTMNKISNRFLDSNDKLLNKVETFIEKIINREYNSKDIVSLNKYIEDRKKQNMIMREVLDNSVRNFKAVNLEKLLMKIVNDHEIIMNKYGINLSLFSDFNGTIYADKKKIYQMLVEIIKNSIEAITVRNKLDKKINIVLKGEENKRVLLEVSDNGIGMEKSELNQLMKPYSAGKKNIIGLGLTTIFNIVREHKGIITIVSELDEGTKIRIIFNESREENSL